MFRNRGLVPLAGDRVEFDCEQGLITDIKERKNSFRRPPVANVDNLVIVVSTVLPKPDYLVIDKLTVIAASQGLSPIIVLTKSDRESNDRLIDIYSYAGFRVIDGSFGSSEGIDALKDIISSGLTVFAGNSGAGKSSLLNRVIEGLEQRTQQASLKLGRGKHTTREVTLFEYENGYIADTPGFSAVDITAEPLLAAEKLPTLFPDIASHTEGCFFADCAHLGEKGCSVGEALNQGKIEKSRYESYEALRRELQAIKHWK